MNEELLKLVQRCYADYLVKQPHYDDINRYYYGNTDSLMNFTPREGRSNLKVNTNFMQKLTDEEAQYSFGNDITYTSIDDNKEVIKAIQYNFKNNKSDHDFNLGVELIKYGLCYEINYREEYEKGKLRFKNKIVTPLDGYMYIKDDIPYIFLHMFKKQLEPEKTYIDIYTKDFIYHCDHTWQEVNPPTEHYFGIVPVGFGMIGGKSYNEDRGYIEGDKTIYNTIKNLQDALETNLSDAVCEISDFRNAIMKIYGVEAEDETDSEGNVVLDSTGKPKKKEPVVRNNCIMLFGDKTTQDADWLIKDVDGSFIKETRDEIKDLIYSLTSHINTTERMQSNLSGTALRSRLQSLEAKCKMNEKAMINIIYTRLYCLFRFLYLTESKNFDVNTIKVLFTPNVPIDETGIADMISKLAATNVVSKETMRSWLPRIENPVVEGEKVEKELENDLNRISPLDQIDDNENYNEENSNTEDLENV